MKPIQRINKTETFRSVKKSNTNLKKRFFKRNWINIKIELDNKFYLMYKHPTKDDTILSKELIKFIGDKESIDIGCNGVLEIKRDLNTKKIISAIIKTK